MKCKNCDKKITIHKLFKGKRYCNSMCEFEFKKKQYEEARKELS